VLFRSMVFDVFGHSGWTGLASARREPHSRFTIFMLREDL